MVLHFVTQCLRVFVKCGRRSYCSSHSDLKVIPTCCNGATILSEYPHSSAILPSTRRRTPHPLNDIFVPMETGKLTLCDFPVFWFWKVYCIMLLGPLTLKFMVYWMTILSPSVITSSIGVGKGKLR